MRNRAGHGRKSGRRDPDVHVRRAPDAADVLRCRVGRGLRIELRPRVADGPHVFWRARVHAVEILIGRARRRSPCRAVPMQDRSAISDRPRVAGARRESVSQGCAARCGDGPRACVPMEDRAADPDGPCVAGPTREDAVQISALRDRVRPAPGVRAATTTTGSGSPSGANGFPRRAWLQRRRQRRVFARS